MKNTIYYNFPIGLLRPTLQENLHKIVGYCIGEKLNCGMTADQVEKDLDVKLFDQSNDSLNDYKRTFLSNYKAKSPMTGISHNLYWEFRNKTKTDFEYLTLTAFLAIKSILCNKIYQKLNNDLLIARMAGFNTFEEYQKVCKGKKEPKHIAGIRNRYQLDKIKKHLTRHYKVEFYGHATRGFFASTKLTIDKLILEVERNREKHITEIEKSSKLITRAKILEELSHERQVLKALQCSGIKTTSKQHHNTTNTAPNTAPNTTPSTAPSTAP